MEAAAAHSRFERASRFPEELEVVHAHEGEAEDGDVEAGVLQRHVPDVARGDAVVGGDEVKGVHLVLHRGGEAGVPAAKVAHDGVRPLAAPRGLSHAAKAAPRGRRNARNVVDA